MKDTYKTVKEIREQGAIVRIHIPDLTEEERERRVTQIHKAAARLLK